MNCTKFHVTCDIMLLLLTILLVDWHLVVIGFFVCNRQLAVVDYYYYHCLPDNQ